MAPHAFVITARDVAILASLADVRYLTVAHLQWLHWAERWREAARAARADEPTSRRPKKAYERAAGLTTRGLVVTIRRSVDRATTVYRRLPDCLSLTRAGAELLACHYGLALDELWYYERATRAAAMLEHSLAIGAFYAALRAELEYRGRALTGWAGDHVLCTDYDSVAVAGVGHPLPIIPDATFALDGQRYFVEIDRGTTRIEQWRKKALAYDAYGRDPRLHARYGVQTCTILVVAPVGPRLEAIARTVASVHQGLAPSYRFLSEERVHPLRIRRRWQRMEHVTLPPPGQSGAEHALPRVTLTDDVLWMPQPGEQTS
ncbi:MAG: replication-relaxation family protein [Chloroflexales bacterium]